MCRGERLLVDFVAGGREQPDVPAGVAEALTTTVDGAWVAWGYKLARRQHDRFWPLSQRGSYPADATAECLVDVLGPKHKAPDPSCSCGFHALSERGVPGLPPLHDVVCLQVVLSGRVLAYEWQGGGVLFRAERQTVVRVGPDPDASNALLAELEERYKRPDDPDGRVAKPPTATPRGSGPVRLRLPSQSQVVGIADDAGWCQIDPLESVERTAQTFARV